MIELTREDRKAIWDLSEQWKDAANQLKNWEFDYDGFKVMAKQTYSWLEKFFMADAFPHRIVTLLLSMKEFSCDICSVSPEAGAAKLLTETLGDPEYLFGIQGDPYEVAADGERELWVEIYDPADDDFHKCRIDTETFDLTPLVEFMEKTGNY